MNMEKKSFIAIGACIVFYLAYNHYLTEKYPHLMNPVKKDTVATVSPAADSEQDSPNTASVATKQANEATISSPDTKVVQLGDSDLRFENANSVYVFSQTTGGFDTILLKDYREEIKGPSINLIGNRLLVQAGIYKDKVSFQSLLNAEKISNNKIKFWYQSEGWKIEQTYTVPEAGYEVPVTFTWTNTSSIARPLVTSVTMKDALLPEQVDGGFLPGVPTGKPRLVVAGSDTNEWTDALSFCEEEEVSTELFRSRIKYVGFDKHYFLKALLPNEQIWSQKFLKTYAPDSGKHCLYTSLLFADQGSVAAGDTVTFKMNAWFGPKESHILEDFNPALVDTLDLGWFSFLSRPLWEAIALIFSLVGNYGLAIIIVTFFLKLLFFPLTKASAKQMHKTKKLQPEMNRIKEKFKDDRQRQQMEIMQFMGKHKINPLKGCLPMLPQIPVFFAFYRVLSTAIELRHAPFYGWIHDLSASDPYYITPILLGVTMLVQQKLTPTAGMDKAQARIMMMLPMFFTLMMLALPAGMVIYMLTNTVVSVVQQKLLNRKLEAN